MHPMLRRLYRIRPLAAMFLCLPTVLLCVWYTWRTYAELDAYRRAVESDQPITAELFHIQLHDVLRKDWRAIRMPRNMAKSKLEVFQVNIDKDNLRTLYEGAEREEERPYAEAKLELGHELQKVRVRLRGNRHWHLLGPKKSLKFKLPKGELYRDHRVFNLIADPTPLVVGEQLILDYAHDLNVLTPESRFARLRVNAADLGVFHFETQPDESLLRNHRRIPGSIYSGNLPPSAKTHELWESDARWKKVASRTDSEEDERDTSDLKRLLDMVSNGSHRAFADFTTHEVDTKAFINFDVLDVAFGGDQHDFRENHKYYFDPYRGRWEPIAWNFRGFRDDKQFNLVDNPITLRLKLTPGYLTERDRRLYEFLTNEGAPNRVEQRGLEMMQKLAPDLRTDPHWYAYHLLLRVDGFQRRMMRPLDIRRAATVFRSEMATYRYRHSQLTYALEANPLFVNWQRTPRQVDPPLAATDTGPDILNQEYGLDLVIDGRGGASLTALAVHFEDHCEQPRWQLQRGEELLSRVSKDDHASLEQPLALWPGVELIEREDPGSGRGKVRSALRPIQYSLQLHTNCAVRDIQVEARHLATGARIFGQPAKPEQLKLAKRNADPDAVPKLEPGTRSAHPWDFDVPPSDAVVLGPGEVVVNETRVFAPDQTVQVQPGTTFKFAPSASLIFLGKVNFAGTDDAPIVLEGQSELPWGGLSIRGLGATGSHLKHVHIHGGTVPAWRNVSFAGMLSINDTSDIEIEHCQFGDNSGKGDVVHVAYVDGLRVTDSTIHDAAADAWDLEFSKGELQRVQVKNIGDDGLDTMGSNVRVSDSTFIDCAGNGLSAGEQSKVFLRSSLIANCKTGVLAKNDSKADLANSVLFNTATGVRVYTRSVRYSGDSRVVGDEVFVANAEKPVDRQDKKKDVLDRGNVHLSLPPPGAQLHLLRNVLNLSQWEQVAPMMAQANHNKVRAN